MPSIRQRLQEAIAGLPDNSTLDDFRRPLHLRLKLDATRRDIDAGRIHSHQEMLENIRAWLAPTGDA